jgi:RNA polymerase sigma factor (sigma-70 family)
VKLVREGHERAFDALVQRYRRPLLRYCRGIGLSDSRAEDVLQLALLNAWLALAGGAEVRDLRPWLYRIAHNGALNALRGPAERHVELSDAVPCTVGSLAEDELDRRIAMCDTLADVAALPPMQRQAILLTAVAGKTHDETAGALGINQDAVRGLLYRARTTLRSAAAVTPQPLLGWASGGAGSTTERLCELSAGGGALSLTAALVKGAAVAVTAGALLGGAAVVRLHAAHRARASSSRPRVSVVASLRGDGASAAAGGVAASASIASGTDASVQPADRGARPGAYVLRRAVRPLSTADPRRTPSQGVALPPRGALAAPDAEHRGGVASPIAQERIQRAAETEAAMSSPDEPGDARGAGSSGSSGDQAAPASSTSPARERDGSDGGGPGEDGSGPGQSPSSGALGEAPREAQHAGSRDSSGASEAPVGTG